MRHKLKAETFFRKIEFFPDVQFLSLTQILSFVVFHLKCYYYQVICACGRDPTCGSLLHFRFASTLFHCSFAITCITVMFHW